MIQLKSVKKSGGSEIYSIQKDGVEIGAVRKTSLNTDRWRSTTYYVFMGVRSNRLEPRFVTSWVEANPCKEFRTKKIHDDYRLTTGCVYESAWVARKRLLAWLNDEYGGQS